MAKQIPHLISILLICASLVHCPDMHAAHSSSDKISTHSGVHPGEVQTILPANGEPGQEKIEEVFDAIEIGILSGDVKRISPYFGRQMRLNLPSAKSGYYSANQSYYLLQTFFSGRKIISFKFTSRRPDDTAPYATGGGTARSRGVNELLQIYVSFTRAGQRWVISEFNIY